MSQIGSTGDRLSPYRLVRHPSYDVHGNRSRAGSWLSAALLAVSSIATYTYRVTIEERALLNTIGEPYAAFMKERKRFIPYIV